MRLAQSGVRRGQAGGTMDPEQRAAEAGDLHEWERSLP